MVPDNWIIPVSRFDTYYFKSGAHCHVLSFYQSESLQNPCGIFKLYYFIIKVPNLHSLYTTHLSRSFWFNILRCMFFVLDKVCYLVCEQFQLHVQFWLLDQIRVSFVQPTITNHLNCHAKFLNSMRHA